MDILTHFLAYAGEFEKSYKDDDWKRVEQYFKVGDYTVSAELMTATPEDIDSTPGNGVKAEDDYAEVTVTAATGGAVHDIPTLSTAGISAMVLLLLALGVFVLRRGTFQGGRTAG